MSLAKEDSPFKKSESIHPSKRVKAFTLEGESSFDKGEWKGK
jgi:hypothetical protein